MLCNAMHTRIGLKQSKVGYQPEEENSVSHGGTVQTSQDHTHEFKGKNRHVENETPESIVVAQRGFKNGTKQ